MHLAPSGPEKDMLASITKQDFVLYHPYDSFDVIVNLLREAARDRDVLEICITMYRMDHNSPVVDALIEAAEKGKKVTAIVELKAKFDEENNIRLVSKLRQGGINTVYNFPKFKVHAKLCLIVKKEDGKTVRILTHRLRQLQFGDSENLRRHRLPHRQRRSRRGT